MSSPNLLESLNDNIFIDKDKCTFCGICVETCILDNLRMKLAPCSHACPLGVNAQGYIQLIARGKPVEAMELLLESLPFPGILGRICSQPCEQQCHRKKVQGQAVAIRALKRYLADTVLLEDIPLPEISAKTGKKVAIIGSGPAGLMAAFDLALKGHAVVVFDSEPFPGGMLRWAIPEFRLPASVVAREVARLSNLGIDFRCGIRLGENIFIEDLKQNFQAIILATGCQRHLLLGCPGENLPGVYHGLPFLKDLSSGIKPDIGNKVIIIGAGNVALDAAQSVLRLGAQEVSMVCLESRDEIPAFSWALESALAEGVILKYSWGPTHIIESNGRVSGVEFQRCLNVFDAQNRFAPCFDPAEKMNLQADTVIVAIGQATDSSCLDCCGIQDSPVDPLTLQSRDAMIFVAGDLAQGPSSVVEAMASGRRAAESVNRLLAGVDLHYSRAYAGPIETDFEIDTSGATERERMVIPQRTFEGQGDFGELELAFDHETARLEAQRCYSCGQPFGKYRTCWFCLPCEVECPHDALWVEIPYLLR